MAAIVLLILVGNFLLCQSGSILRNKRGYLSRTGLCAKPEENFKLRDPRLNFWGVAYVLPDDANPKCTESECSEDSHCDADRKCCKNHCGGMVCTPTTRDPNPCKKFQCPSGQTCKVQYVPCVMPKCKDAIAINRPTCIKDPSARSKPSNPTATPKAAPYAQTSMYPQQAGYQQPELQYPQDPLTAQSMPPMRPIAGFQNDEPEEGEGAGDQSNLETDLNDAALQNENQPLTFQNENPLTSEDVNFFQPPTDEQQPVVHEPPSQFPADIASSAPQRAWDRSSKGQ